MAQLSETGIGRTTTDKPNMKRNEQTRPKKAGSDGYRIEKRVRGIEPPLKAWEAFVLPLNHTRKAVAKLAITPTVVKRRVSLVSNRGVSALGRS